MSTSPPDDPGKEARRLQESRRRAIFRAVKNHPVTVQLSKHCQQPPTKRRRSGRTRKAGQTSRTTQPDKAEVEQIGEATFIPGCLHPTRPNLTIMDGDIPILQRIRPTSADQLTCAIKSAKRGHNLFENLKAAANSSQTNAQPRKDAFILGCSHSLDFGNLSFAADTLFWRSKVEATIFLWGAKNHTTDLLQTARPLLHPYFVERLKERESISKEWLSVQLGEEDSDVLHPWWTTISLYANYTPPHNDSANAVPSFLFNFGEPCLVSLHDCKVSVAVEPYEILIMNTCIDHSIGPCPSETSSESDGTSEDISTGETTRRGRKGKKGANDRGKRWAFSAFYREAILCKVSPSPLTAACLNKAKEAVGDDGKKLRFSRTSSRLL